MFALLQTIGVWLVPILAAILIHDVAQASVARWMGDAAMMQWRRDTPHWRYLDPLGSLVIPLALAFAQAPVFGWGRRMPLTMGSDRRARLRLAVVAIVGPVACLVQAMLGAMLLGALVAGLGGRLPDSGVTGLVADNLFNFILASACMATFHLIPLPPFDLGRALAELAPERARRPMRLAGRLLALAAVALVVAVPLLDPGAQIGERIAAPVINAITGFVLGLVNLTV